jgi:hypothetical protein
LEQENHFDELNWFASTKTKFEGESENKVNKIDVSANRSAFTNLKLWRATPSVGTEHHKVLEL